MYSEGIEILLNKSGLVNIAGDCFCSIHSNFVKELQLKESSEIFFGIQKLDEYTLLGRKHVFYRSENREKQFITLSEFTSILKQYTWKDGKKRSFEYVPYDEGNNIWVMNSEVMSALWHLAIMISRSKK